MHDHAEAPHDSEHKDAEAIRDPADEKSVFNASRLSARLIYEVIRRDGEEELARPTVSLIWSGIAAGILISLSVIAQSVLRFRLPDAEWAILIESLGYSVGFMVVIFGRMQLFTENTITTVLPVITEQSLSCFMKLLRLWGIVLTANVVGAGIASGFLYLPHFVPPDATDSLLEVAHHAVDGTARENFYRAIPAGIIIAAIVWIIPAAQKSAFFVILTMTWLMAAAGFAHVIAGSVEAGLLVWFGEETLWNVTFSFFFPVLVGNVLGGTAVFTLLTWGQVKNEVTRD
ncbi:formate/nitrite transporter family protein [Sagittula salina]|uniref:Formate/nitrite transporter family protein n=1 Tax=Sagittula salina TaxID=2820268 RepID=A0A940S1F9_9RHOB|nr:formate/nitrite transporter family protein [Sagittula salina]MBP0483081.1 formate/nitrite transporter family protein [Sagittula salina]